MGKYYADLNFSFFFANLTFRQISFSISLWLSYCLFCRIIKSKITGLVLETQLAITQMEASDIKRRAEIVLRRLEFWKDLSRIMEISKAQNHYENKILEAEVKDFLSKYNVATNQHLINHEGN
ncbi:hypothetical protein K7432_007891 [Basidiobolus ranarum]|uniref:Uncharacterized protein n=1 Tax=Basidiobolus ranarum TaxID=34480 RepID=A0ABR2WST4_9FUNG